MWRIKPVGFSIILGLYLVALSLYAGETIWDNAKEQSVANKLSRELESGEVIWLSVSGDREFPGIFTRAAGEYAIAIILIHGMGGHPDWPEVISPLRNSFAENGWTTFSIQMPVLPPEIPLSDYGKTVAESQKRIGSAIDFLNNKGYESCVLIGYGFGASTAANFLASSDDHRVHAFAGISMQARKYLYPDLNLYASLEKLTLPVLDVYGSEDLKTIINTADQRRLAAHRNGNYDGYQQAVIWNADHYFSGHDQELFVRINRWLEETLQIETAQLTY